MESKIHHLDCLEGLGAMSPASVHCCVTSPPYFGLRDYKIEPTVWPAVDYSLFGIPVHVPEMTCCLGLEKTPHQFIGHLVHIFRKVHRVLRNDGTLWLNMGDSYAGYWGDQTAKDNNRASAADGHGFSMNSRPNFRELNNNRSSTLKGGLSTQSNTTRCHEQVTTPCLKPKDLIGIPWMLAFALRDDGWYLRQDIIWHKPNPMPESVYDRCTKSHEYIFLLSKSKKYYYDHTAIMKDIALGSILRLDQRLDQQQGSDRVPGKTNGKMKAVISGVRSSGNKERKPASARGIPDAGLQPDMVSGNVASSVPWEGAKANKRSVWTVTTKPFKEAHFATFPEDLIVDMIKAGSPIGGLILDPFSGAGTTFIVARKLNRHCIAFEKKLEYVEMSLKRAHQELGMFL